MTSSLLSSDVLPVNPIGVQIQPEGNHQTPPPKHIAGGDGREWIWRRKLEIGASSVYEDFGYSSAGITKKYVVLFEPMTE